LADPPFQLHLRKCLALKIFRLPSGQAFPALDCCIDINRIDFDAETAPAGALGGKNGGAAADVGIQDNVVALGRVQDRVGNQRSFPT
jgi:hypothetical protein